MKQFILFWALFLFCWETLTAQDVEGQIRTIRNLSYVPKGSAFQQLDLYLPTDDKTLHPLVIWIHGGGWLEGTKDGCPAKALVSHGYAAASLNYRLSQQAIYPAQIEDCKAAVRWLRAHSSEYAIDPKRIGVWGASAGGHLAALLGTTGKMRNFDLGDNLDQTSEVQCVVDWFGPSDFLHWGEIDKNKLDAAESPVAKLLGGAVLTHQAIARQASPTTYVNHDSAPFLIMHGSQDGLVPLQQSNELNDALKKAGVEGTLKIIPGAGHGGPAFGSPENLKLISNFLNQHLMSSYAITVQSIGNSP